MSNLLIYYEDASGQWKNKPIDTINDNNKFLRIDSTAPDGSNLAFANAPIVTNLTSGTGITLNPSTIVNGSGSIALSDTAVTPATYSLATVTVNQQGRVTSASNGSGNSFLKGTGSLTASALTVSNASITATSKAVVCYETITDASVQGNLSAVCTTGQCDILSNHASDINSVSYFIIF